MLTHIEEETGEKLISPPAKTFRFVFAREVVEWQICYEKTHSNTIALISCKHSLFKHYFPDGMTRIHQLISFIRNEKENNPKTSFFVSLIDSYSIT